MPGHWSDAVGSIGGPSRSVERAVNPTTRHQNGSARCPSTPTPPVRLASPLRSRGPPNRACCMPWASERGPAIPPASSWSSRPRTRMALSSGPSPPSAWSSVEDGPRTSATSTRCSCSMPSRRSPATGKCPPRVRESPPVGSVTSGTKAKRPSCTWRPTLPIPTETHCGPPGPASSWAARVAGVGIGVRPAPGRLRTVSLTTSSRTPPEPIRPCSTGSAETATHCTPTPHSLPAQASTGRSSTACAPTGSPDGPYSTPYATPIRTASLV